MVTEKKDKKDKKDIMQIRRIRHITGRSDLEAGSINKIRQQYHRAFEQQLQALRQVCEEWQEKNTTPGYWSTENLCLMQQKILRLLVHTHWIAWLLDTSEVRTYHQRLRTTAHERIAPICWHERVYEMGNVFDLAPYYSWQDTLHNIVAGVQNIPVRHQEVQDVIADKQTSMSAHMMEWVVDLFQSDAVPLWVVIKTIRDMQDAHVYSDRVEQAWWSRWRVHDAHNNAAGGTRKIAATIMAEINNLVQRRRNLEQQKLETFCSLLVWEKTYARQMMYAIHGSSLQHNTELLTELWRLLHEPVEESHKRIYDVMKVVLYEWTASMTSNQGLPEGVSPRTLLAQIENTSCLLHQKLLINIIGQWLEWRKRLVSFGLMAEIDTKDMEICLQEASTAYAAGNTDLAAHWHMVLHGLTVKNARLWTINSMNSLTWVR